MKLYGRNKQIILAVVKIPVLRTKVATVPTVTTSLKGRLVGHARRVLAGLVVVEQHCLEVGHVFQ